MNKKDVTKWLVEPQLKKVEKMDRKEYLKYYIKVLEENIFEANKVLSEKKKELKKLR